MCNGIKNVKSNLFYFLLKIWYNKIVFNWTFHKLSRNAIKN